MAGRLRISRPYSSYPFPAIPRRREFRYTPPLTEQAGGAPGSGGMIAQSGGAVAVEAVAGRRRMREFLALPRRLYADDPAWVAPLDFEQRQRFAPGNPFFRHARWRGWLARRGGRAAGRITAQIDERHLRQHGDAAGYFGMLEGEEDPEIFLALCAAAEEWLRGEGMRRIRGPYNLHINEEAGLLVEGFHTPPSVLMGHARPWYGPALESLGYRGVKDLLAYHVRPDFPAPPVMARLAEWAAPQVAVRPLQRGRGRLGGGKRGRFGGGKQERLGGGKQETLAREAARMRDIFNDAWQRNWGFVPLDEEVWLDTVKTLSALIPADYIQIAEVDGEPAAFIAALPNLNEAARDLNGRLLPFGWLKLLWRLKAGRLRTARVALMGVRQRYQRTRLGPALAFMVIDAVRRALHARGVEDVEMGWILEDNAGMRNIIETIGGVAYKRYRMYEKEL